MSRNTSNPIDAEGEWLTDRVYIQYDMIPHLVE